MIQNKQAKLRTEAKKLLHESWHNHESAKPFIKTLLTLFEENKLSDFDMSFLSNWLGKKAKGRFHRADEQARSLAILYSNKLGEKLYTTNLLFLAFQVLDKHRKFVQKI